MIDYEPNSLEYMLSAGRGKAITEIVLQGVHLHKDLILDHLLHNRAFDPQLASGRSGYLWPILNASEEKNLYRDAILQSMLSTRDCHDANQLCDFALTFALESDVEARTMLYEKCRRNDVEYDSLCCANHLIELDGIDGLLYVLNLAASDTELFNRWAGDDSWIRHAEDKCGIEPVRRALQSAQKRNPNIATFLESVSESYTTSLHFDDIIKSHQQRDHVTQRKELVEGLTWQEFKQKPRLTVLTPTWGRYATDEEIKNAAHDVVVEEDPERLARHLRIFCQRKFPLYPGLLVKLFERSNLRLSITVLLALSKLQSSEVRHFFNHLVKDPEWSQRALVLLQSNYQDEDHLIIQRLLDNETDVHKIHDLASDAIHVFQVNSSQDSVPSLKLIYEKTPCSYCREKAVELLDFLGQLPEWMLEECRFDASENLRVLAQKRLGLDPRN